MVRLAWPMVVIQLLQVAYNLADTFWLGRLSATAVGALSLAFPIIFFLISVGGGFTAAGSILVAQYTGAREESSAGEIAGQTLSFVAVLSVVLGVLGFLVTSPMLALLPTDPATKAEIVPLAAAYMRVFFLGSPALFGFFVFTSLMRGYGDTRSPMRIMLVSVVVNVVIDPILIFGWGPVPAMGIQGAAVATVVSRSVATVLGLYVIFGTSAGPTIRLADLRPRLERIREIVRLGVPTAIEQSTSSLAMILMTGMVATFPPAVVAAYGLGNRLQSLVFLPAMGLGQAVDTVVGQNLGADRPDRAERASHLAMGLVVVVMVVLAVAVSAVPEAIVGVFLPADTPAAVATTAHASEYIRIGAVAFAFLGVLQVGLGTFRGAGNTKTALAFSALTLWVIRLPLTYVLVFVLAWGPTGLWTGVAAADIVGALAALAWLSRGTWKRAVIDADGDTDPEATPGAGDD